MFCWQLTRDQRRAYGTRANKAESVTPKNTQKATIETYC